MIRMSSSPLTLVAVLAFSHVPAAAQAPTPEEHAACAALAEARNLTITSAGIREGDDGVTYCYARGTIPPAIGFHVQIPLREHWNGRFLMWGDGGKDGDLDFADHRVAEGYAVANTTWATTAGPSRGRRSRWTTGSPRSTSVTARCI
ncbi:MAG TPA: hypothetical protein VM198_01845 [Longimicrobiales bacterium]|nr:hypothetical protein [Longimicrobiales bacterium]